MINSEIIAITLMFSFYQIITDAPNERQVLESDITSPASIDVPAKNTSI